MSRGALFCPEHRSKKGLPLDLGTLMLIQQLRKLPLDKIWRLHILQDNKSKMFNSLVGWLCAQIGKEFKSLKLLGQLHPEQDML